jgi:hypothetical protein
VKNNGKIYHSARTVPKSNSKIIEKGKKSTLITQIHYCSLSWLDTSTSITIYGKKSPKKGIMQRYHNLNRQNCIIET